ncbi:MAG: cytidine deaminase [Flavobacteriales bacterium]|jgi:cytidine deaminase|nr:cytidine deaminase [Flavobacteriales bacterium]
MKKKTIEIAYQSLQFEELSQENQMLIQKADEIRDKAYAVYSDFYVGAALLLDTGDVVLGNNQENIAFPSSLCAERVAIFYCKANYPNSKIRKLAITAKSIKEAYNEVVTPCGSCRQVISEYERNQNSPIEIILKGQNEILIFKSINDLLPLSFETLVINPKK